MTRSAKGWIWVAGQMVLAIAFVLAPWDPHGPLLLSVGLAVGLLGVILAVAAARALGSALTPTPVPIDGAELRTHGVYGLVRHPIYSALLLIATGAMIAAGTGIGMGCWVAAVIFFVAKARWEDALLAERHGAAWQEWARHTGALLPRPPQRPST